MMESGEASAGLRRLACERCFDRKQKCDRALPSCSACSTLGVACKDRPWPSKVTDDTFAVKHGSVVSYVESLKRKIHDLRNGQPERPGKRARRGTNGTNHTELSASHTHHGDASATSLARSASSRGLESPGHHRSPSTRDTMGEIGFLSRSAMAEPRSENMEPSRNLNLNLYKMIVSALALDSADHSIANGHRLRSQISDTPAHDPVRKLDREGTIGYMTLFVNHVCLQYPFLSAKDAMRQYDMVMDAVSDAFDHASIAERGISLEYFNTCLGIAIGGLLSQDSSQLSGFVDSLHWAARRMLPVILRNQDGLIPIKCMLLLAIFSLLSPSGGSAWHLIGLIVQKCVALGLEKEQDYPTQDSHALDRINVFWTAYILDRSISLTMGRPCSIQDEDVTVRVPPVSGTADDDILESTLKYHLITQARLASQINSNLDQPSILHYHNICFWRDIPAQLKQNPEKYKYISEHLEHLTCRMLMQLTRYLDPRMPAHSSPSYIQSPSELTSEVELDIMNSCKRFMDRCYDKAGDCEGFSTSFLHITDVFCAGVVYVTLARRRQTGQLWVMDANEMLQKGLLLMTLGGGAKFSASRVFHKALLAISGSLVRSSPASNPLRYDEMFTSLRRLIPGHIYTLATQVIL